MRRVGIAVHGTIWTRTPRPGECSDFGFSQYRLHVQPQHSRSIAAIEVSLHLFSESQVLMARVDACFPHQLWEVGSEHHLLLPDRVGELYQFLEVNVNIGWMLSVALSLTGG
jgi:hypothetical protein